METEQIEVSPPAARANFYGSDSNPRWNNQLRPNEWINLAVNMVFTTHSVSGEEPFIMAVNNLEASLTVPMRKRLEEIMKDCNEELEKQKNEVPVAWSENERGWKNYITAKYMFKSILQAIYETMPDNRIGQVG